jgi:hypothetical protein
MEFIYSIVSEIDFEKGGTLLKTLDRFKTFLYIKTSKYHFYSYIRIIFVNKNKNNEDSIASR